MKLTLLTSCASDLAVVNAARVSFGQASDEMTEKDEGLIRYLIKNRHGSPFEHGYFRFHVEAPIFVLREWQRHRAGHSYNEMSGRYVELEPTFYRPHHSRRQVGKPGSYSYEPMDNFELAEVYDDAYEFAWDAYQNLLQSGVAKEQARMVLPVGTYSQMIWSCNPRSLMHFLSLRTTMEAQAEIRDLALEAEAHLSKAMPVTHRAWADAGKGPV